MLIGPLVRRAYCCSRWTAAEGPAPPWEEVEGPEGWAGCEGVGPTDCPFPLLLLPPRLGVLLPPGPPILGSLEGRGRGSPLRDDR